MVLEHQGLLNMPGGPPGLQPALQLYAAAAAQLAPRNRVPPWAPFLRFGVPGLFGSPFLTRPHFGGPPLGHQALNGMTALNGGAGSPHSSISPQRSMQGPPSEDSNDERGKCERFKFLVLPSVIEF